MAAIVPVLVFFLLAGLFSGPWRRRAVLAAVSWGVCVLGLTELLSLWQGVTPAGLLAGWTVVLIAVAALQAILRPPRGRIFSLPDAPTLWMTAMAGGIALATAVVAYYAAPNNWDSMTYHMARVAHWAQNKTVAMYPTLHLRQLIYPPWSSYAILQFYVLAGNDRLANFIQWFAAAGSMAGTSLIVQRLKGGTHLQALAAVVTATVPMGILQSTSTQNDYVTAFWLACFVYFGLCLVQEGRWPDAVAAGAGLGLACLVKGLAYIYGLPFLVWFGLAGARRHGRKYWLRMAAILCLAAALNSSYYVRNWSLTGRLIPPSETSTIISKTIGLKALAANLLLNVALHAQTVWDGPNRAVEKAVDRSIHALGFEQGDGRFCIKGMTFQILSPNFRFHEDYAGNCIHALLILCCLAAMFFLRRQLSPECKQYVFVWVCTIVLFVIVLKWNPFQSRYHLPGFVLAAPFVAIILGALLPRWAAVIPAGLLTLAAVPWVTGNMTRPLMGPASVLKVPRLEQYFVNSPADVAYIYPLGVAEHQNCRQIGLDFRGDTWEYPLEAIAAWQDRKNVRFEHVFVSNESAGLSYPLGHFAPCLIIQNGKQPTDTLDWQGHIFKKIDEHAPVSTYWRVL